MCTLMRDSMTKLMSNVNQVILHSLTLIVCIVNGCETEATTSYAGIGWTVGEFTLHFNSSAVVSECSMLNRVNVRGTSLDLVTVTLSLATVEKGLEHNSCHKPHAAGGGLRYLTNIMKIDRLKWELKIILNKPSYKVT